MQARATLGRAEGPRLVEVLHSRSGRRDAQASRAACPRCSARNGSAPEGRGGSRTRSSSSSSSSSTRGAPSTAAVPQLPFPLGPPAPSAGCKAGGEEREAEEGEVEGRGGAVTDRPRRDNPWNAFQRKMTGRGLTRAQMRAQYRAEQDSLAASAASHAPPMVSRDWNDFQRQLAGRGLGKKGMAQLYRSSAGCPSQALLLLAAQREPPTSPSASALEEAVAATALEAPHGAPSSSSSSSSASPRMPSQLFSPLRLPNLGYACCNAELREQNPSVYITRTTPKAVFQQRGLPYVSSLALCNCRDLLRVLKWNENNGIRFFRVPVDLIPWADHYEWELLPDFPEIASALKEAGEYARLNCHRITCHPSHYVKLASPSEARVAAGIDMLERHSKLLDLMGLPANPTSKINIHIGGVYGNKNSALERFAAAVRRLSPRCRARLTVENDDAANAYSVKDLLLLSRSTGVPLVFDVHHHSLCDGGLEESEALHAAAATWPKGMRPVVHWSEGGDGQRRAAHSDFLTQPIRLHGLEDAVDVMVEAKGHEQALLRARELAMRTHIEAMMGRVMMAEAAHGGIHGAADASAASAPH